MKKYELTNETITLEGEKLFRIKALRSFGDVKVGELGGYVASEDNLTHSDNAWVYGNACIFNDALVYGNAKVYGNAWVYGNARVYGDAWVYGDAEVYGDAWVYGSARVYGNAWVYGDAEVADDAWVCNDAEVYGEAEVYGNAQVYGDAEVYDDAWVYGDAKVYGNAKVYGDARVYGNSKVRGNADIYKTTHIITVGAIGSRDDFATFFRAKKNKICVVCGCFTGDIDTFKEEVKKEHAGTKHESAYKLAIDLAKLQIELD